MPMHWCYLWEIHINHFSNKFLNFILLSNFLDNRFVDFIQILIIIVLRSVLLNCNDIWKSIKWKCAVCGLRSMDGLELTKSIEREIWDAVFVLNACTMNRGSNFWSSIFLILFSLKNINLGAHFLLLTFFDNINF